MENLDKYIPEKISRHERLKIVGEHFYPILHKNKVNKKRMKSFKGKAYYFKRGEFHFYYKIHDINFKTGPQYRTTIVKEINSDRGKLYYLVKSYDDLFDSINLDLFFSNHAIQRYKERLNLGSFEQAFRKFISELDYVITEDGERESEFRGRINSGLIFGEKDGSGSALIKTFIATEVLNYKKTKFKESLDDMYDESKDEVVSALEEMALAQMYT